MNNVFEALKNHTTVFLPVYCVKKIESQDDTGRSGGISHKYHTRFSQQNRSHCNPQDSVTTVIDVEAKRHGVSPSAIKENQKEIFKQLEQRKEEARREQKKAESNERRLQMKRELQIGDIEGFDDTMLDRKRQEKILEDLKRQNKGNQQSSSQVGKANVNYPELQQSVPGFQLTVPSYQHHQQKQSNYQISKQDSPGHKYGTRFSQQSRSYCNPQDSMTTTIDFKAKRHGVSPSAIKENQKEIFKEVEQRKEEARREQEKAESNERRLNMQQIKQELQIGEIEGFDDTIMDHKRQEKILEDLKRQNKGNQQSFSQAGKANVNYPELQQSVPKSQSPLPGYQHHQQQQSNHQISQQDPCAQSMYSHDIHPQDMCQPVMGQQEIYWHDISQQSTQDSVTTTIDFKAKRHDVSPSSIKENQKEMFKEVEQRKEEARREQEKAEFNERRLNMLKVKHELQIGEIEGFDDTIMDRKRQEKILEDLKRQNEGNQQSFSQAGKANVNYPELQQSVPKSQSPLPGYQHHQQQQSNHQISQQDPCAQSMYSHDIHPQDMCQPVMGQQEIYWHDASQQSTYTSLQNMPLQEIHPQGMLQRESHHHGMPQQDMHSQGMLNPTMPQQGAHPQGLHPQGLYPQGMNNSNMSQLDQYQRAVPHNYQYQQYNQPPNNSNWHGQNPQYGMGRQQSFEILRAGANAPDNAHFNDTPQTRPSEPYRQMEASHNTLVLEVGDAIQSGYNPVSYGTIKWIGEIPGSRGLIAGVEMVLKFF